MADDKDHPNGGGFTRRGLIKGLATTAVASATSGAAALAEERAKADVAGAGLPVSITLNGAQKKGVFEPRTVTVGAHSGDYAVILSGLRAGEQVVTRANFLIDSESNLRQSVEGMQSTPAPVPAAAPINEKAAPAQKMGNMPGMAH